jgi:hypothetical protein
MGKQTRRGFLAVSGAVTAAALIGCAAGAPPNSKYQGTYRSVYAIPGAGENGTFNYSVEQKGKITGALVDSSNNKVWSFNGSVANDGKFNGTLSDGAQTSPVSGTLSPTGGNFETSRSGLAVRGDFQVDGKLTETQSTFQGTYTGVYSIPGLPLAGTNNFTVDSKGNLIGSISRGEETGLMSGTVSNAGTIAVSARFAGETLPLAGTIIKTVDGTSQGNFTATRAGVLYPGTFAKATVTIKDENGNATEVNPFQGAFRGTYGLPERGENGSLSFTADKSGKLTGFFSQTSNAPVATFSGGVQADGLFSGTLTYTDGTASRAITGRMALTKILNTSANPAAVNAISGDFTVQVNGVYVPGNFEATIGASEVNSSFRGSYTAGVLSNSLIPSAAVATLFPASSGTGFSVDLQGSILGTFGGNIVSARLTNDGRIVGLLTGTDGRDYPFRGIVTTHAFTVNVGGLTGTYSGLYGTILVTVAGKEQSLVLQVLQ